jgi:predicted RNase H-like HicB family nuclease
MEESIKKGISLKIEDELGRYNTIPFDSLVEIVKSLRELYSKEQHSLSYSPETVSVSNKKYVLNYPLRCLFDKEDNYYVIRNEQLDIIGTGESREEAETNFSEEFDYLYVRLNSLEENQLSGRLVCIRQMLNNFVREVK